MAYSRFGRSRSTRARRSRFAPRNMRRVGRGRLAKKASRLAYRRMVRRPKRAVAKAYANTVGQITYRSGRRRPSHGRGMRYGRRRTRSFGRTSGPRFGMRGLI